MADFRTHLFSSLVILPTANALGHLAPAIGGSWAAVGLPTWDYPVLILLFSVHALLDSYDKYRDLPQEGRPLTLLWTLWAGSLFSTILWGAYECGYSTSIRLVCFLGLEVLWPTPLIPMYTPKRGFRLIKLKQVFGPFKSVFCGVMAGLMDTAPATLHACLISPDQCTTETVRLKSLTYSILYNFVRETIYDARDIAEDSHAGITTLPTCLGMTGTIFVLAATALGVEMRVDEAFGYRAAVRAIGVVGVSSWVAITQPRENRFVWAVFSLTTLVPAWSGQAALTR